MIRDRDEPSRSHRTGDVVDPSRSPGFPFPPQWHLGVLGTSMSCETQSSFPGTGTDPIRAGTGSRWSRRAKQHTALLAGVLEWWGRLNPTLEPVRRAGDRRHCRPHGLLGTIVTGNCAECRTLRLVEPRSMLLNPPRPWLPTTTS